MRASECNITAAAAAAADLRHSFASGWQQKKTNALARKVLHSGGSTDRPVSSTVTCSWRATGTISMLCRQQWRRASKLVWKPLLSLAQKHARKHARTHARAGPQTRPSIALQSALFMWCARTSATTHALQYSSTTNTLYHNTIIILFK